ncbi:MAG: VOC family protein [Chitinophagaceae bacterium]|nr:VOC family protein [Chitinophagaceae bacterium]
MRAEVPSLLSVLCWLLLAACQQPAPARPAPQPQPGAYFEIPVSDMPRAVRFYEVVFGYRFQPDTIDGHEMAIFQADTAGAGIGGALAKGSIYQPDTSGVLIYLRCADIAGTLQKATAAGGKILYAQTPLGDSSFVAEIMDSEGNRIALLQRPFKN